MNENIAKGSYRTADGRAQIDWELCSTPKGPEFSASGSFRRSSGQCIDGIAKEYPSDEMVQRIHQVWKKYHLNGMRAGTLKQESLGWGHGRDIALDLSTMNDVQKKALEQRNLDAVTSKRKEYEAELLAKLGSDQRTRRKLWNDLFPGQTFTTWADESIKDHVSGRRARGFIPWVSAIAERLSEWLSKASKERFPVAPVTAEIFKDSIGAPCPETGKLYGHEWYYHAIPEPVLAEIRSWPSGEMGSHGEFLSKQFLSLNEIDMRITLSDSKPAPWDQAGHHYRVTLSRKNKRLVFDFWGSANDAALNRVPSVYDVLSCVASDVHCPITLQEFCSEYGEDPDSIKTRQTFVRASRFAKKLRAFFTEKEIRGMAEIS